MTNYIYHQGTGTLIAASECIIVNLTDDQADAVSEGEAIIVGSGAPAGARVPDPWEIIDLGPDAIREHYMEHDRNEDIAGLDDEQLYAVMEWARDSSFLWDSVYAAWDAGIDIVKAENSYD